MLGFSAQAQSLWIQEFALMKEGKHQKNPPCRNCNDLDQNHQIAHDYAGDDDDDSFEAIDQLNA